MAITNGAQRSPAADQHFAVPAVSEGSGEVPDLVVDIERMAIFISDMVYRGELIPLFEKSFLLANIHQSP
ncbi:hypothetical protein [Pontibacter sp. G13]|uniref:hypothetical protein n=1 Tax=Pontibacter sp. G13 TaxID=3074898 RepID=UPI00288C598D|nr:hypothetical protein [Pontibacter sp. G13]WNJ21602.1 hypothetical protein RJD25_28780 [Pontibacter sp. G13]